MKKIVVMMLGTFLLTGCTVRVADLTMASTKNYNLNGSHFLKGKRVTAEDSYPVFILPAGIPNTKTAIDRAIEGNKCAVGLSDVVVTRLNHAFIFGRVGVRAQGNLIIDRSLPGCENAS